MNMACAIRTRQASAIVGAACFAAWVSACASGVGGEGVGPALERYLDEVSVDNDDVRLEHSLQAGDAAAAVPTNGTDPEVVCKYLPAATRASDKVFRFADGNTVVFPASPNSRIWFITAEQGPIAIAEAEPAHRKTWWCQKDGLVLFRAITTPEGKLSAINVDWYDSKGTRLTETRLNIPAYRLDISWAYRHARVVDDCLGLSFRIQKEKAGDSPQPPRFVEYKLCPTGI